MAGNGAFQLTKLIIQIPCYNEEATLGVTLDCLPRVVPGIDRVELLVIDDGSVDRTAEVALARSVHHLVRLPRHMGLAKAFRAGLEAALDAGADIIVNLDADNQYCAADIPKLVAPILAGKASIVIGARPIGEIEHFSPMKKMLEKLGSWLVRRVSCTDIADAPSGFRAINRNAAMRLNVFSDYTYTLETVIQAGQKRMAVISVPVGTNGQLRPSRLMKSTFQYVSLSLITILRTFMTYRPLRFFVTGGVLFLIPGFLIGFRFLYLFFFVTGEGHIQSLLLSVLLVGAGFFMLVMAFVVDLIAVNRHLLEDVDWRIQRVEARLRTEEKDVVPSVRSRSA
jgi:glycosyltransferase involved in cell wall biosynthesis